jgi:hypothetical protein
VDAINIHTTIYDDSTNVQVWTLGEGGGDWYDYATSSSGSGGSFNPFPTNWPGGLILEDGFLEASQADIIQYDTGGVGWPEWIRTLHSARTYMQLNSGGVAALGVTKLLRLTGTAAAYTGEFPNYALPGDTPVLGNQIAFFGQMMSQTATNPLVGELFVTLPAGFSEGLTPEVFDSNDIPVNNFSFDVQVQDENIQITANGNPLDPNDVATNAAFCVGQDISFMLTNLPPGVMATNFQWAFGGNYFNAQSNAGPGTSVQTRSRVPYVEPALLAQGVATNWWVSGGLDPPNTYIASVTCTLVFTNGNSTEQCEVQGEFNMYRPRAAITTQTRSVFVGPGPILAFGLTNTNQEGIVFTATISVPTGFSGSNEWVQIVTDQRATRQNATNLTYDHYSGSGLDTLFPYGSAPPSNPLRTADSPDFGLQNGYLEFNALVNEYEMWLLFRPDGLKTHFVPLRAVNWSWSGSATNTATGWSLENGTASNSVNPSDFETEIYPRWTNNITNQYFWTLGR